jgi:hypothetical protein
MSRRAYLAALLTLAATLWPAPAAQAGTYTVHSCTTPSGTPTGMEGWSTAASSLTQGEDPGLATNCSPATPFGLEYGATQAPVSAGKWLRWMFTAPPATRVTGLTVRRSFELGWPVVPDTYGRPYVYDAWHDDDVSANQFEFYFPPYGGDTVGTDFDPVLEQTDGSWESVSLRLRCWELMGSDACGPFRANLTVPRATFTLTDTTTPASSITGGNLAGQTAVRGTGALSFHATDTGSGVYRTIVTVDGHEVARTVVDADGGSCGDVEPGNGDAYEFGSPQPCQLDASTAVQLDTASLQDGPHALRVAVEDAAGNVETVHDGTLATHNAPIATQPPALAGTTRVGAKLTATTGQWDGAPTGFGYRWLRCDGDGNRCAGVAGADGPAYAPTSADAYHRLKAQVTAGNAAGSATATTTPSARIADVSGRTTPPAATAPGTSTTVGGIQGLVNPLGHLQGHVGNGANATGRARIEIAFRLSGGRTATKVRSPRARRWAVVGRLTGEDGRAIGSARLGVAWKVLGRGWVARATVRTRADGRFDYVLPAGPSRQVKLTYFAFSDSGSFVASNVVQEDVLAPLTIRADRRRVGGDRVVKLSGRVGGGTIPRSGLLVTLQGYQAGWGWRTFRTVRTTRRGRWTTSYRFRLAHGRFGFRAVVPRQGGHPYVTTHSAAVVVTVG